MSKSFDMELFIAGGLSGSYAARQRHVRQAKFIQFAIEERWGRDTPRKWQRKHLYWLLRHRHSHHSHATRYYYRLTFQLLTVRLGKGWVFED